MDWLRIEENNKKMNKEDNKNQMISPRNAMSDNTDIVRYQLDSASELEQLIYELRGYERNYLTGVWDEVKGAKEINDKHINQIVNIIRPVMRKQWTLSDIDKERILLFAGEVWDRVFELLYLSGDYSVLTCRLIRSKVMNYCLPNMMRAKDAITLEAIRTVISKHEVEQTVREKDTGIIGKLFGKKQAETPKT